MSTTPAPTGSAVPDRSAVSAGSAFPAGSGGSAVPDRSAVSAGSAFPAGSGGSAVPDRSAVPPRAAVHVPAGSAAAGLVATPSGILLPADIDPFHRRLHRIAPSALLGQTTQTSGMRRLEAISGKTVGARNLWMGQTHVPAATNSGNHHHGASETAIYVVSGTPVFVFVDLEGDEPVETRVETGPGDYIFVPPYVPHREENPDPETEAVVVISRTTQEAVVVNLDALDWAEVRPDPS